VDFRTNLHIASAPSLAAAVSTLQRLGVKSPCRIATFFALFFCLLTALEPSRAGAEILPAPAANTATNAAPRFNVTAYVVEDHSVLPTNDWTSVLSKHTGDNLSLNDLVKAASDLQTQYSNLGYPNTSIAVAEGEITNGMVTLNVFQTAIPQI
jgi:hemolysin activation/secretion protein